MRESWTRQSQQFPPELDRLLLDANVNAYLKDYLKAVGFDVVFAIDVDANIHDDTSILIWARSHNRILVTHDKFRDGATRFKLYLEIYNNGGKVLQVIGGPQSPPLTSLGKILVNREKWSLFFSNNDGLVRLSATGMKSLSPGELYREIQGRFFDTPQL